MAGFASSTFLVVATALNLCGGYRFKLNEAVGFIAASTEEGAIFGFGASLLAGAPPIVTAVVIDGSLLAGGLSIFQPTGQDISTGCRAISTAVGFATGASVYSVFEPIGGGGGLGSNGNNAGTSGSTDSNVGINSGGTNGLSDGSTGSTGVGPVGSSAGGGSGSNGGIGGPSDTGVTAPPDSSVGGPNPADGNGGAPGDNNSGNPGENSKDTPPGKLPPGRRSNRPPIPDTAKDISDFGHRIMQWGEGSDEPRLRITTITREFLIENHVTIEIAQAWADFYAEVVKLTPKNNSAPGRYDLMIYAVQLLKGN